MLNKNYSKANQLFGSAAGVSELNEALGVYYLKQGHTSCIIVGEGSCVKNFVYFESRRIGVEKAVDFFIAFAYDIYACSDA